MSAGANLLSKRVCFSFLPIKYLSVVGIPNNIVSKQFYAVCLLIAYQVQWGFFYSSYSLCAFYIPLKFVS